MAGADGEEADGRKQLRVLPMKSAPSTHRIAPDGMMTAEWRGKPVSIPGRRQTSIFDPAGQALDEQAALPEPEAPNLHKAVGRHHENR